jgi:hypothetical protein
MRFSQTSSYAINDYCIFHDLLQRYIGIISANSF